MYMCVCVYMCVYIYIYIYIYHIFIHSSVNGHLSYFHVLATENNTALNIGMHVSFQIGVYSRYMTRSGIAGSYGNSIFISLRNLHSVHRNGHTIYISPNNVRRAPFSPFVICRLSMMAILASVS